MSFVKVMREYYMKTGMSYKEASYHASKDYDFWRKIFLGEGR